MSFPNVKNLLKNKVTKDFHKSWRFFDVVIFDCSEQGVCAVNCDAVFYKVLPNILEMCQPVRGRQMPFKEGL